MSYPVFAYTEAGLHLRHFYYAADQVGPDTVVIGSPRVLVTLDYGTYDVLDANFEPFDLPLFEDVKYTLSPEERAARRPDVQRLEALYDQMLAPYPEVPDGKLVDEFGAALHRVVPPVLWPYYSLLLTDMVPANE